MRYQLARTTYGENRIRSFTAQSNLSRQLALIQDNFQTQDLSQQLKHFRPQFPRGSI